jgi:hypothetical protein
MALLWELRWVACFTDPPSVGAGMGWWIAGIRGWGVCFVGVCFGFGNELFGAAYHLRDECHILNIFGVTVWGE